MSGPFKMKGFSYPGEAPAKESPAKIFGGLKKFGSKLLKGHDGKFDAYRQSQKDPNAEQEIKTEVANLPDNEKDEILTKVVQEKKEAEASGDTGDATL